MSNFSLTGKIRYRTESRWFRDPVVILQVEEMFGDGPPDYHGMPTYLAGVRWRDAKVEDLLDLKAGSYV